MNEEQLLKRKIIDTANQAFNHNIYTYTNFLSINELSSVNKMSNELSFIPYDEWGGNPVCERKIIRFGSEELYGYDAGYPISTIRIIRPVPLRRASFGRRRLLLLKNTTSASSATLHTERSALTAIKIRVSWKLLVERTSASNFTRSQRRLTWPVGVWPLLPAIRR